MVSQSDIKKTKRVVRRSLKTKLLRLLKTSAFGYIYLAVSLVILLSTTLFWSILGAKVQIHNSDQLSNSYILGHINNFHNAILPGQHTFLLKWPLFLIVGAHSETATAINALTVIVAMITVTSLAVIIYLIERRPLVSATLLLGLASCLLLVPAEPYPGALLPVNMAMLTTRNIEYIVYIATLYLIARSKKIYSWLFLLAVIVLALVIGSDKLFLALSTGGAILCIVIYGLVRRWSLVGLAIKWLICSAAAGLLATSLIAFINDHHIVHIVNGSSVSPYGFVSSPHTLLLAIIYAILGVLTIFGANPSTDDRLLRQIPHQAFHNLFSASGLAYAVNIILIVIGLAIIFKLVLRTITKGKHDPSRISFNLSVMLIFSTIAAVGIFVGTSHYYPVDARYLSIALFTIFIAAADFTRRRKIKPEAVLLTGLILLLSVASAIYGAKINFNEEINALRPVNNRDILISQVLKEHSVHVLVGDYWRVLPSRLDSGNKLNVMPLVNCTQPLTSLTSNSWNISLKKNSFAYLLTLDKSLTDYPSCSLKQITDAYGQPNASTVIAGTIQKPNELLLFYDGGTRKSSPVLHKSTSAPASVVPAAINPNTENLCQGPSVMNIVAHQDDDLLFMNPDTIHSIQAGYCIRTIYITAGDGGQNQFYWLGRERGSEMAYSEMTHSSNVWVERPVQLSNHEVITVANPRGNPKISLIFFRLPDGNLKGQGFVSTGFQSVSKLKSGEINTIRSVDGSSFYTLTELQNALETLMETYQPTIIRTQLTYDAIKSIPDHSDHMIVGQMAQAAYKQYEKDEFDNQVTIPINYYVGYPIRGMDPDVSGLDFEEKITAFLVYAQFDPAVCQSSQQCTLTKNNYSFYLTRQYSMPM